VFFFLLCSGRREDAIEKLRATQQVAPSADFRGTLISLHSMCESIKWRVQTVDCMLIKCLKQSRLKFCICILILARARKTEA
jgi:hypothetical protein